LFELKLTSVDKASREQIVSRDLTLIKVINSHLEVTLRAIWKREM